MNEVRFALRYLRRSSGFIALAVFTLAVVIDPIQALRIG